jgi:hypothetical protein
MPARPGWYREVLARAFTQGQMRRYAVKALGDLGLLSSHRRLELGVVERPAYGWGLLYAAKEAAKIGYEGITAIEFGVAAGHGLLAMERHAAEASRITGVSIELVGFDSGGGLPPPTDYRDAPFFWNEGSYPMDEALLRERLDRADLVLGDVRETARKFLDDRRDALLRNPIGFVSFDLDYWSSTVAAFEIFRGDADLCMPRVTCYFDDTPWTIEDVGEERAIHDFNEEGHGRKIRRPIGLRLFVPFEPVWADQIFQAHLFDHPKYAVPISTPRNEQLE